MSITEEVLKALNQLPFWRRLSESPNRIDELEKRVAELEAKLKSGGSKCPECGGNLTLTSQRPHPLFSPLGKRLNRYKCTNCAYTKEEPDPPER